MIEAPVQEGTVGSAQQFEATVEHVMRFPDQAGAALFMLAARVQLYLGTEHVMHHGRDQGARQKIRCHHGEDHRHGERSEQVLGGARQQQYGDEDDADGQGWRRRPARQSARRRQYGAHQRFAHGHVAMRVFDFDGGIVHQGCRRRAQATERHHVDRLAEQVQYDHRRENRQGDRDADNHGAAPASQKQQDHQTGEHGRDHAFVYDAIDGGANEERLVEELFYLERGRQASQDLWQRGLHVVDDCKCGCLTVAQDSEEGAAAAVRAHHAGLDGISVADLGHVLEITARRLPRATA